MTDEKNLFDAAIAGASGVVLWFLNWIRQGMKENRDTHETLRQAVLQIKDHLERLEDDEKEKK